jgi:nucleoside-diphosphate kinase
MERTLIIIKPDAVRDRHIGEIISRFEKGNFNIIGLKMLKLSREECENFYYVHYGKEFYERLINFMISGEVVCMVLEGEGVIKRVRDLIGPTNPKEAPKGTIRGDFGSEMPANAVHASDSLESAKFEVNFFFPDKSF